MGSLVWGQEILDESYPFHPPSLGPSISTCPAPHQEGKVYQYSPKVIGCARKIIAGLKKKIIARKKKKEGTNSPSVHIGDRKNLIVKQKKKGW